MSYQGIYIDRLETIVGTGMEDNVLSFVKSKGFTTISLYNLQKILHKGNITQQTTNALAAFIKKARSAYGVLHVAGIAENADFFASVISAYNHTRTDAAEKMDVYNVEFEFWNQAPISEYYCADYLTPRGYPCDTDGAYKFFKEELVKIHTLAKNDNCVCETYVGWPNAAQASGMYAQLDRILIHAYVTNPATAYQYTLERLEYYARAAAAIGKKANIIIIFSAEEEFSGPWLHGHTPADAYNLFIHAYNAAPASLKNNIVLLGYQWYNLTEMRTNAG